MRMLDQLFGSNPANLERAMNRASLRHELISKNLANVNTPGYKRQDIDFAVQLDQEMGKSESRIDDGATADSSSIRVDGSSVDLEKEVVEMSDTELRYQMLSDLTGRYFAGLKSVIREGR